MKNKLLNLLLLISAATYAQMPVEGFEGETFPPEGWNIYDNGIGISNSWMQTLPEDPFYPPYEGEYAAFIDNENVPDGTVAQDWLVTPLIQISGSVPGLHFFSRQTQPGNQGGIYKIMMSIDTDPSNLESYTVIQQWTEPELNPMTLEYNEIFVPIPLEFVGQQAYFAFVMEGDNADRWLIDNVSFVNTMGTEDFNLLSVKLYPNPVKDRLYIDVQNDVIQSAEVYDINGRLCQSHLNVQDGIDTTKLAPGLYFVKVKSESESEYSSLKFIKE